MKKLFLLSLLMLVAVNASAFGVRGRVILALKPKFPFNSTTAARESEKNRLNEQLKKELLTKKFGAADKTWKDIAKLNKQEEIELVKKSYANSAWDAMCNALHSAFGKFIKRS